MPPQAVTPEHVVSARPPDDVVASSDGPALDLPREESSPTPAPGPTAAPKVTEKAAKEAEAEEAAEAGSVGIFAADPASTQRGAELPRGERDLLQAIIREATAATTGVLTDARLNQQAKKKIREAYSLANRRAHYAARQELIEVVRMISQSKDARQGVAVRTVALAAGFRALDEAEDFVPRGTQLEAEMNLALLTASHRTPIAKEMAQPGVLPQQMMAKYYRYAQLKLALAVAGEPAGSMALHTLGKIHSQLGKIEPQRHRLASRRAIAFQQASLLAHHQNHLAAHELAVLLADSGHLAEAQQLLLQVAAYEPNAIVYRNLALVQDQSGRADQAAAYRAQAALLASQGASGTRQVPWIAPDEFARIGSLGQNRPRYAQASARTPPPTAHAPSSQSTPRSSPCRLALIRRQKLNPCNTILG